MKKVWVFALFVVLLGAGLGYGEEVKIGVVSLRTVFDSYEKTKEYNQKLSQKTAEIDKKIQSLQKEIEKLRASLEVVGEKERPKKIQELRQKEAELRRYQLESMRSIGQERDKYMREILKDIKPVITEYAKKHGYKIILNEDMLLYSDDAYDLTDEIVDILNRNYKKDR